METSQNLNSEENISYCHITPQIKIEKTFDEEDSQQQYENTFDDTTTNNDFFIQKYESESMTNNSEQNDDFFQTNNDHETIQMEHPLLSILSGEEYNIDINTHTATKLQTICNQIEYHQELNLTTQILFDGKFFTLKARDGNSLIGTCMICTPNRDITGASYSNFKAHLLRNHGQFMITKLNKHIRSSKTRLGAIERANSASSFDEIYQNLSPTYKAIFDGTFFTLISKNDKKLVASCQLCQTPTQIRGTLRSSANFQAHIQRIHGYSVVRQLKEHLRKSRKVQSYERKQSARHERDSKEHLLKMNRSDSSCEELNDSLLLESCEDNKDDILLKESLTHNQIDIHNYYNENEARKAMYKSLSLTYQTLFDGRYFILKWKTSSYNRKIYCSICLLCKRQIKGQHLRNFRTHIGHFHGTAILEQFNKHINLETSRLEIDNVVSKEMEKSLLLSLLNNDDEKFDTSFPWSVDDDTEQDGPSSSSNNLNNLLKELTLIYQILFDGKFFKLKSIKPYAKYNKKLLTATCKICRRDINGQHIIHFRRHLEFKHGEWVMDKLNEHIDREKLRLEPKIEENDEIQTNSLPTSTTTTKSTSAKTSLLKKLNPDLQTLFDGKYFTDLRVRQSGNKVGTCKVCKPHADVKGNAVAHFRAHLKRKHGDEMVDEVNKYILSKNPRSESKNDESSEIQTNLLTSTTSSSTTSINRQKQVLNYFLKPSIPLSAVNSSEFWTMLDCFDTKMPRITQEELVDQIEMKFNNWKSKIIELLKGVDFVCTTIDLWSKKSQYNLAITCHWIDVETFKRRSVALAWKCFVKVLSIKMETEENIPYCHITPHIKIEENYDEENSQQYENTFEKNESESITTSEQDHFFQTNDNDNDDKIKQMEHPLLSILSFEQCQITNQIQYHQELNLTTRILFDGKFFTLKGRHGNSLIGTCMICTPHKDMRGPAFSDFKRHLFKNHDQSIVEKLNKHISSEKNRLGAIEKANSAILNDEFYRNLSPFNKALFDGTFFTIHSKNDKIIVASCQLCPAHIRGSLRTNTNFRRHIKSIHGDSVVEQFNEHLRTERKQIDNDLLKQSSRQDKDGTLDANSRVNLKRNRNDSSFETLRLESPSSQMIQDDNLLVESLTQNEIEIDNYYNENENRKSTMKSLNLTYQILFDGRFFLLKWKHFSNNRKIYCTLCVLCKRQVKGHHFSNFRSHISRYHGTENLEQFDEHITSKKSRLEIVTKKMEESLSNNDEEKFDTSLPWCVDDETEKDGPSSSSNYLLKDLKLTNQILFDGKFFKLTTIKPYKNYNRKLFTAICKICQKVVNGIHIIVFRKHLQSKHGEWVMVKLNEHIDREKLRLQPNIDETNSLPTSTLTTTTKSTSATNSLLKNLNPILQRLFDGKYFVDFRVQRSGRKVGTCKVCKPQADVKGNAVADFRAHLKRKHGDEMVDEVNKYILSKQPPLELNNDESREIQTNLLTSTTTSTSTTSINRQTQFNTNVLNYFLRPSIPLSELNSIEFWTMFECFDTKMPRITQEEVVTQIEMKFDFWKSKIIELLEGVDFVCATIDLWSKKLQYNLAITCHWIDVESFKRKSVALAWKCFDTSPDQCVTDVLFKETLNNFNLSSDKIVSNVTKNCYNFSQIFKDLNINTKIKVDTINENHNVQTKDLLPSPYNCYTETLSCIATIDVPKVIESNSCLKEINELTLKKVFSFLSLASTCPKLSEMLTNLKKPDITKWNTIFNSISCVLKLEEKSSFTELFNMVKLEHFTDEEVKYLREYVKCLSPLAMAFERLQCEQGTYQGFVLPTLLEMRKKCVKLQEDNDLTVCQSILETILDASMKRFEIYFKPSPESECLTIASLSHPFFKEKWVTAIDNLERKNVRELFINAVKCENSKLNQAEEENIQETVKCEQEIDEFYFGEEKPKVNTKSKLSIEVEVLRYLDDERRDLKMLDDYPTVKRVFLKYNTGLSSSEPFEKLFPIETRENIARYDILADELIEERVLLSVNKDELVL